MTATVEEPWGWRLHREGTLMFWVHPIRTTRFLKRRKIADITDKDTRHLVFETHRTWYHTRTREFDKTVEVLRTIDDVIADGTMAVYDWRDKKWVYAEGALDRERLMWSGDFIEVIDRDVEENIKIVARAAL